MSWTKRRSPVPERLERGLLDTSVVIDLDVIDPERLPRTVAVSAITMAELAAALAATPDLAERARRQDRLQRAGSRVWKGSRCGDGGRAPAAQEVCGPADRVCRGGRGAAPGDAER